LLRFSDLQFSIKSNHNKIQYINLLG
jgi:hypothetical protein